MKPRLQDRILAMHKEHLDWSAGEIGRQLNCCQHYVARTLRKHDQKLAGSATVRQLGIAAMAEGLTLADIRRFKYLREIASRNEEITA